MSPLVIYLFISISSLVANDQMIYTVPIHGTIDMGLPHYIDRVIKKAELEKIDAIIFDIDTFGGRIDAATKIKDLILDTRILTIGFINKRAISAGALISLSCDYIFMTDGASIGAATAVDIKGDKASEKVISYMREEMATTAEANDKSRKIAAGMVDENLYIPFIIDSKGDTLTGLDIEGFNQGKLITLSTQRALALGIADKKINNSSELLNYLNLDNAIEVLMQETWSEKLVRFLTNPTVAPIFMSLGMLGLMFEIKSPGFGIPGLLGLVFLALFFGSHLLVGLADFNEIMLLCLGFVLILLEIIAIPSFGIVGIAGILISLYAFFKMLIGVYPNPEDFNTAYLGLSIGIITTIFSSILFFKLLVNSELYKQVIPFVPQKSSEGFSISKGYERLINKEGIAITDLRPSGKIIIKNTEYYALSYGDYIEKNTKVIVSGLEENQLLVKKL